MKRLNTRWMGYMFSLILGGCMLPQPHTPPIGPPGRAEQNAAAPGKAAPVQAPPMAAPAAAPAAGSADASVPSPSLVASPATEAVLSGKVGNSTLKAVSLVPVDGSAQAVRAEVALDGSFTLSVPAGSYWLEAHTADRTFRAPSPLTLSAGESRRVAVSLNQALEGVDVTEQK